MAKRAWLTTGFGVLGLGMGALAADMAFGSDPVMSGPYMLIAGGLFGLAGLCGLFLGLVLLLRVLLAMQAYRRVDWEGTLSTEQLLECVNGAAISVLQHLQSRKHTADPGLYAQYRLPVHTSRGTQDTGIVGVALSIPELGDALDPQWRLVLSRWASAHPNDLATPESEGE